MPPSARVRLLSAVRKNLAGTVYAACLLLPATSAWALDPIDTDGPDFVESSEVVPQGHFQYEVDATAVRNRRGVTQAVPLSAPTLLKYGIAPHLELRVETGGYQRQDGHTGMGDTAIGFKWHTQDRDAATGAPSVSWIFHLETPTGSSYFRGHGARPSLRTVMTWDLPWDLALGIMPGLRYDSAEDGHRYTAGIFGAVLNKRLSDSTRVFAEVSASQIAHTRDGGTVGELSLGAAWLLGNDTQLGLRTGVGANHNSPRRDLLLEIAQRF
jgi:hypothetical protein